MAKPNPSKEDRPINQSIKMRPIDRATVALILKGHAELSGLTDAIRYALAHWRRTEGKDLLNVPIIEYTFAYEKPDKSIDYFRVSSASRKDAEETAIRKIVNEQGYKLLSVSVDVSDTTENRTNDTS